MIRLVAADMDGTLLTDDKKLHPETIAVIKALRRRNVVFVIASGRQYYNLKSYFEEGSQDIIFICENGALVYENGVPVSINEIVPEGLVRLLDTVRAIAQAHVVACGVNAAYTESRDPAFLQFAGQYFRKLQAVECLNEALELDRLIQVSIYHPDAETVVMPNIEAFRSQLDIHASERCWVDAHKPGINKGTAIRFIQARLGLCPSECMAFGDYLNDMELVCCCEHSFAMQNSHPKLAEACRYRAESNNEGGVVKVLQKWLGL